MNSIGNNIPTNGLVLDIPFDWNGSARIWLSCTPTNFTWWKSEVGYINNVWVFNWTNASAKSTTTVNLLWTSNDFTFTIWIYPWSTQITTSNIFDYNHGDTTTANRGFTIQQNADIVNNYSLYFRDWSAYVNWWVSFQLTANVWQLLTCVKIWTTISHYINNVQQSTWTVTLNVNKPTAYFMLGDFITTWVHRWFNWKMWLCKIYNRGITQDERQLLYLEFLRKLWPTNIPAYPKLLSWLVFYGKASIN